MKIKKILVIILIFSIFINISCISATECNADILSENNENNIYIDVNNGNDNNDGNSWQTSLQTIEKAINLTDTNTTTNIYLNNGTYSGEKNTNLNITNKNKINIIGSANTIINGENKNIFTISNNTKITLQNIQFTNAYINNTISKGGAINFQDNTEIIIENCQFTNNTGEGNQAYGGAINIENSDKILIDYCIFENNTLISYKNQYSLYGGAININNSKQTVINNTLIKNNKHKYIEKETYFNETTNETEAYSILENLKSDNYVTKIEKLLDINNNWKYEISAYKYNNALSKGGAINIENNIKINIENCQFTNNNAQGEEAYSGAINIENTTKTIIKNNNFENNSIIAYNNQNSSYGGAINIKNNSEIIMENNTLIQNNIKRNIPPFSEVKITMIKLWEKNYSYYTSYIPYYKYEYPTLETINNYGKAINIEDSGNLEIKNNIITNNSNSSGNTIQINNTKNIIIYNNTICNNTSNKITLTKNTDFILITNGTINIENSENIKIIQNKLENNIIKNGNGGTLYINNNKKTIIENNTITSNTALNKGGAIYITNSDKTIPNCKDSSSNLYKKMSCRNRKLYSFVN